jgi:uncharacterized glyoxalase superfamily protein PhnB
MLMRSKDNPEPPQPGRCGQVQMPFAKTFFSPGFGMVADRFGVSWTVCVAPPQGAGHG